MFADFIVFFSIQNISVIWLSNFLMNDIKLKEIVCSFMIYDRMIEWIATNPQLDMEKLKLSTN